MSIKSNLGPMLERAEMFEAKPVDRHAVGYTVMPVKETRRHALSSPQDASEESTRLDGRAARLLALLSPEERAVYELQARRFPVERETRVGADRVQTMLAEGWLYVRAEEGEHVLAGLFHQALTYEDMAQHLGLSVSQVHRRVKSINRKLRGAR